MCVCVCVCVRFQGLLSFSVGISLIGIWVSSGGKAGPVRRKIALVIAPPEKYPIIGHALIF